MTCERCGADAPDLGECPFCHRMLCLRCYDADTGRERPRCHPTGWYLEARRMRREGATISQIIAATGYTRRSVFRALAGGR